MIDKLVFVGMNIEMAAVILIVCGLGLLGFVLHWIDRYNYRKETGDGKDE